MVVVQFEHIAGEVCYLFFCNRYNFFTGCLQLINEPLALGQIIDAVKANDSKTRSEVMQFVQIFRAKIVDVADDSVTIEVVGDPGKMVAIVNVLQRFGIREIARTGKIALTRESGVNTEYLKSLQAQVSQIA